MPAKRTSRLLMALVLGLAACAVYARAADLAELLEEKIQRDAELADEKARKRYETEQRQKEMSAAQACQLWTYRDAQGVERFFPMRLQPYLNGEKPPRLEIVEDEEGQVVGFKFPRSYGAYSLYDVNGEHVLSEQGQNGAAEPDYTLEEIFFTIWTPGSSALKVSMAAAKAGKAAGFTHNVAGRGFRLKWREFLVSLGKKNHAVLFKLSEAQKGRILQFSEAQLKKKGWGENAHAAAFGVVGPQNKANLEAFKKALQAHVTSNETIVIAGAMKGEKLVHYLNPASGLNVIATREGAFRSGSLLNPKQLSNLLAVGKL